jgi:hypothetical protein
MAFNRHRYLEMARRIEEICTPQMMVENRTYHMHANAVVGRVIVPLRVFPDIESLERRYCQCNRPRGRGLYRAQ